MALENRSSNGQFEGGYHASPQTEFKKGHVPQNRGVPLSEERKREISRFHKGKVMSKETKRKMSKSHKGKHLSKEAKQKLSIMMTRKYRNADERKKQSERMRGENNPMYGRIGKGHPSYGKPGQLSPMKGKSYEEVFGKEKSEEIKRKLSESMTDKMRGDKNPRFGKPPAYPKPYKVLSIPHIIRSSWEEEIALMLIDANINYNYEVRFPITIDDKKCNYNADFAFSIGDKKYVVEPHSWFDDYAYQKFEAFNNQYPDITFIILSAEKPVKKICDIFIDWKDRSVLIDKIEEDFQCRGNR